MRLRMAASAPPARRLRARVAAPRRRSRSAAGAREYVASDYPPVLKRWTREESLILFSELDDKLTVTATFESWDFRWAYVVRYAADYRLTIEQRRELLERTLHETEDDARVLRRPLRDQVALGRSHAARRARGSCASSTTRAARPRRRRSRRIVKPGPIEDRYFPYTTVWRHAFRIRFPRQTDDGRPTIAPNARWFGLRFAGAEGNEELHWDIGAAAAPVATARPPAPIDAHPVERTRAGSPTKQPDDPSKVVGSSAKRPDDPSSLAGSPAKRPDDPSSLGGSPGKLPDEHPSKPAGRGRRPPSEPFVPEPLHRAGSRRRRS